MVKLEPKTGRERPDVNFAEWDSMLRICFNRKNKTLRASWLAKEVLAMVTKNYRIWASMNNVPVDEGPSDDAAAQDDEMEGLDAGQENATAPSRAGGQDDEWQGFGMDVDDDGDDDDDDDDDGDDDDDDDDNGNSDEPPAYFKESAAGPTAPKTPSKRKKTKVEMLVRGKLEKVLEETASRTRGRASATRTTFSASSTPYAAWPILSRSMDGS